MPQTTEPDPLPPALTDAWATAVGAPPGEQLGFHLLIADDRRLIHHTSRSPWHLVRYVAEQEPLSYLFYFGSRPRPLVDLLLDRPEAERAACLALAATRSPLAGHSLLQGEDGRWRGRLEREPRPFRIWSGPGSPLLAWRMCWLDSGFVHVERGELPKLAQVAQSSRAHDHLVLFGSEHFDLADVLWPEFSRDERADTVALLRREHDRGRLPRAEQDATRAGESR